MQCTWRAIRFILILLASILSVFFFLFTAIELRHQCSICHGLQATMISLGVVLFVILAASFTYLYQQRKSKHGFAAPTPTTHSISSPHSNFVDATTLAVINDGSSNTSSMKSPLLGSITTPNPGSSSPLLASRSPFISAYSPISTRSSAHSRSTSFSRNHYLDASNADDTASSKCTCSWPCFARGSALAFIILVGLIILGAFSLLVYLRLNTLPHVEGDIKLSGLKGSVKVTREPNGAIHIEADNDHDLFFAQGVVSAQERLWQMEFQRRVASGTLSAVVGDGALDIDKLFRTLGVYASAQDTVNYLNSRSLSIIKSYVDGINSYLASGPPLPFEFRLFAFKPDPWTLADVVAWTKVMQYSLAGNLRLELLRHKLSSERNISDARLEQLIPQFDTVHFPTVLSDQDLPKYSTSSAYASTSSSSTASSKTSSSESESEAFEFHFDPANPSQSLIESTLNHLNRVTKILGRGRASNNWVVSGNLTSSGLPFLANDPHLVLTAPSIWILFHLRSPMVNTIGCSFPGVPSTVLGHNFFFGYGITNTGADVQDTYIMVEQPGNSSFYKYRGAWKAYDIRNERIAVKKQSDVNMVIRQSVYGPVITDIGDVAIDGVTTKSGPPLSLQWVSLLANDTTLDAILCMPYARGWTDFRNCVKSFVGPSSNMVYADTYGNIGYQMSGKIPVRAAGHDGTRPVVGDGTYDWQGFLEFDNMPRTFNPPEGFIVSANNRVTPPSYPFFIARDWDAGSSGYRAKRITELIQARIAQGRKLTMSDMKSIQLDSVSLDAFDFKPLLALISPSSDQGREYQQKLLNWDGDSSIGRDLPTVYSQWYLELARLPSAEVGQDFWLDQVYLQNVFMRNVSDSNCRSKQECLNFASRAFDKAAQMRAGVVWGSDVHKAKFAHEIFTGTLLDCFASRYVSHGGTSETINVGSFDESSDDMMQTDGSSYRNIQDFSDLDQSLYLNPLGQSGNMLSNHYDDLLNDWAIGNYLNMKVINFEADKILTLSPSN